MTNKDKKRIKKRIKNIKKITNFLTIVAIFLFVVIIAISGYEILKWNDDNKKIEEQANEIIENTDISLVKDNENTEIINEPEDEFDPYWDYIKIPLINVDFDSLLETNQDTVGWIQVSGTNINYPVVQAGNNDYYLDHAFDESWNDAGWIFMDYRNDPDNFDENTIIYGHSRYDKSMFGSLRNIVNNDWYQNKDNHIVKFSTPTENTLWQVFSVYTIEAESYYITTDFNDDSFKTWLETMQDRSKFDFNTTVNTNDKILTLSSCYTSDGIRVVLHAKLIKREVR